MHRLRLLLGVNIFWLALSMLGEGLNTLLLPSLLLGAVDKGMQATVLGTLTFAGVLVGMLIQPVAGLASDRQRARLGRRPLLALGTAGMLLGLALLGSSRALLIVFFAYALTQIAAALAQAAQQGWLPDLVPPALRGTASGVKGLMDLGGALLAFTLLSTLLGQGQVIRALWVIGGVIVLALAVAWGLVQERTMKDSAETVPSASAPRVQLREAFQFDLRRHREFAWLIAARFLFLLGTYAVGRFFLFFIADRLSLDAAQAAEQAGGLLAVLTLITALSAPLGGWAADRWGRIPLMLAGAGLSAIGTLLLAFADGVATILIFGGLMALGSAAFSSANWAHSADLAPPAEAGRFLGLANFGTAGAVATAGLFGPLVDSFNNATPGRGFAALFVVAAALAVLSGLAAQLSRGQAPGAQRSLPLESLREPAHLPEAQATLPRGRD
jgi:MFS family permease